MTGHTAQAIHDWAALLGPAHVICDRAVLQRAGTATFATGTQVHAILRPGSRDEVQGAVHIANRHRIPLYPVSSGKNWGYGSRAPVQSGVILDLSRLNRIVDYNEELAYVTVEPGVTQQQLFDFLQDRGGRLWMDATGASPDCSIIGNTMERGFGHTPMGDHCGNACGLEIVLPNGECIETGFGRFPGAQTTPLGRWGVGPALDGLFSQSNLGIVTRMSVWLMPAPEAFQAFFFLSRDERGLAGIIDALRPLRLNGTLRSVMHIGNDYKVLTATSRYPYQETQGRTPLGHADMQRLRSELNIGAWNGSGGLYGTPAQVRDARAQLRRALRGKVDRLQFVDDRLLRLMARFATPFRWLTGWDIRKTLGVIEPVYGLLKGVPTRKPLSSAYWRTRHPTSPDLDPDRDGCGLLWCSPVVPNSGANIEEVSDLATATLLRHGFEPQMSISLATDRTLFCVITISYDRAVAGEDDRAMACYRDLMQQLIDRGYPPYRLNVAAMEFGDTHGDYERTVADIKRTLDPNGILAPGRYQQTLVPPATYESAGAQRIDSVAGVEEGVC